MSGELKFTLDPGGRDIEVSRDSSVPDEFWLRLRAEWGQRGSSPNFSVKVSVELFSHRHNWLPEVCRRFQVKVETDEGVAQILSRLKADREALRTALSVQKPSDERSIIRELEGTRFVRKLQDFQVRDSGKLLALGHGANFSVPGAGKTTVELAIYEAEKRQGLVEQMMVIAPLSAFSAWIEDSAESMRPNPVVHAFTGGMIPMDAEIVLVNYQRLTTAYDVLASWISARPTLVVLDEAHRMKRGRDGEWGAACLDLSFLATRRDVLTGTPAPQHPSDLVAILNFLWPGHAERLLPPEALVRQPDRQAVSSVSQAIGPLFARTTKGELALPETTKHVVRLPLAGLQREIYESLRLDFSAQVSSQRERVDFQRLGEITMYLLEAATNPALLPAGSSTNDLIEFRHPPMEIPKGSKLFDLLADYSSYETPPKFIQLASMVRSLVEQDRKVLIWSSFVRNIESLRFMLAAYNPAVAYGGVSTIRDSATLESPRDLELNRFRNDPDCRVLLANPAAIGEGVSLHHTCHDAIYLDRTFNAGQFLQSVDRIHRLGLRAGIETNITFFVTEETIDEAVLSRVDLKARNLGLMLDDPHIAAMTLPDEDDEGPPIDPGSSGDIEALFSHLRGET